MQHFTFRLLSECKDNFNKTNKNKNKNITNLTTTSTAKAQLGRGKYLCVISDVQAGVFACVSDPSPQYAASLFGLHFIKFSLWNLLSIKVL